MGFRISLFHNPMFCDIITAVCFCRMAAGVFRRFRFGELYKDVLEIYFIFQIQEKRVLL